MWLVLGLAGCGAGAAHGTGDDGRGVLGAAGASGSHAPTAPGVATAGTGAAEAHDPSAGAAAGAPASCEQGDPGCDASPSSAPSEPGAAGSGGGPAAPVPSDSPPPASGCGDASTGQTASPFGCEFAWGRDDPGGSLASYAQLDFISKWVGYEVIETRELTRCDGCQWLADEVSLTPLLPVYYAYFIGFLGKAYGLPDGNENPDGPNLTTHGAQLIRDHRAELVEMYAQYARQSAQVWTDRPLVWLLEGDFIQYATSQLQQNPLSLDELAALARDIGCAIKGNMPSAVVAINHTTWNSDEETNGFWDAMASAEVDYDLVWTTGVADNAGFMERTADASTYNAATATYAYVAGKTGRKLFVDTSFGLSAMQDSWVSAGPETLEARIADGVIAAHVTELPVEAIGAVLGVRSMLQSVCR